IPTCRFNPFVVKTNILQNIYFQKFQLIISTTFNTFNIFNSQLSNHCFIFIKVNLQQFVIWLEKLKQFPLLQAV
ncbi:hypothetical protein CVS40_4496, partial [Lucilia cuprina]